MLTSKLLRLQNIHTHAAVEREKIFQTQAKKAIIDVEMRARAKIHANRREVKKQKEAAARRKLEMVERQRQLLTGVALGARMTNLKKVLVAYREIGERYLLAFDWSVWNSVC